MWSLSCLLRCTGLILWGCGCPRKHSLVNECCFVSLSFPVSSLMGEAPPTLLQEGSCNTGCCESKCTTHCVDRNWNRKYFCEKLTSQLLYLNHAFLIGHMFSVHEHMLRLVFVMLLPNYGIMVNFSQNPYDQYLEHWNFSFHWSLPQLRNWITFRTIWYWKRAGEHCTCKYMHLQKKEINLNEENEGFMMEGRLKLQRIMSFCHLYA